jgi:ribulose-phosphate 3-epimerase
MHRKVLVAPSILSADFAALGKATRAIVTAGEDRVHVDGIDGPSMSPQHIAAPRGAAG